jgi:hypothetical protein
LAGSRIEILATCDSNAVECGELRLEGSVVGDESGLEVPVFGLVEGHALPLTQHGQPDGDALNASRTQLRLDLSPKDGREAISVKAVEDAAGLLGPDERFVDGPGVSKGMGDRLRSDLVKDDPFDVHAFFGLEDREDVPTDTLALAVFVGGEQDAFRPFSGVSELGDAGLAGAGYDVVRFEPIVHIHAKIRPRLLSKLFGELLSALGQVAHVPVTGRDLVATTQKLLDGLGLGRRFHDDERFWHIGSLQTCG